MPNHHILDITFRKIQREWGHDVLLQRRIVSDGGDIYGLPGNDRAKLYTQKLEKWTVYSTYAGRKNQLTDIQEERPEGLVRTVKMIFFFQPEANPGNEDRIYQPDPRYDYTEFLIDYANPVRGYGGKIVYWEVGATREKLD